jgi:hypothetical protein
MIGVLKGPAGQGFEHVPALGHLQGWLSELMAA